MSGIRVARRCSVLAGIAALWATASWAQVQPAPTTAGPGRIICRSATSCELGVGIPPSIRYHIDVAALPGADKDRLVKQCTAKAPPCVATVTGAETRAEIKAAGIKFYN
jgi:hypothetical protein